MSTVTFQNLFGIKPSEVKNICVLAPFLSKGLIQNLNIDEMKKGNPFSSGQNQHFTFIYTHIGAPHIGDAVLYLKQSSCQMIILIGACGLIQGNHNLKVGDLVTPRSSLALESFSDLLLIDIENTKSFSGDENLRQQLSQNLNHGVSHEVNCATMGSIKLEEDYVETLKRNKVDVVDMECSAFFSAAAHISRKAVALFYITDIVGKSHAFAPLTSEDQKLVQDAQTQLTRTILEFTKKLSAV